MLLKKLKVVKDELRRKHKKIRQACPPELKASLDGKIAEKFLSLEEYKNASTLFAYVSSSIEIGTEEIILRAFADGKKVAVPKCTDKDGNMDFYYITSYEQLKVGTFSILEPDVEVCKPVTSYQDGICVVPGLCFDNFGFRVGFGKGYYDRFLQKFKGTTVGLCYSKCIEKEIPKGIYDKCVDILITDKYINYTNNVFSKG